MASKNSTKAHGSTKASLFGQTAEALRVDRIIKMMHKPEASRKFTDPNTDLESFKILFEIDGEIRQAWFNTYQKDGTPQYVGEKCDLDNSNAPISEADFDARCAEKGYVAYDGACPPQIALIGELAEAE